MIRTKFDDRFREVPLDSHALKVARKKIEADLPSALGALKEDATELDKIDYYRLLSRASDLDRFEFSYANALAGFEKTSIFWTAINWDKAAFLCDLKAALCRGYLGQIDDAVKAFGRLLSRLEKDETLQIYELFLYQYRGQVFAFHENEGLAKADFQLALDIASASKKKKQIERFAFFLNRIN